MLEYVKSEMYNNLAMVLEEHLSAPVQLRMRYEAFELYQASAFTIIIWYLASSTKDSGQVCAVTDPTLSLITNLS